MNQHKRSPHSIFDFTYSLGKFLLFLIKLQVFWFLSVLKGCILLGTFPASVTVLKFFYHLFEEKQIPQVLYSDFQTSFNNLFISTRLCCWHVTRISMDGSENCSCVFTKPFHSYGDLIIIYRNCHSHSLFIPSIFTL